MSAGPYWWCVVLCGGNGPAAAGGSMSANATSARIVSPKPMPMCWSRLLFIGGVDWHMTLKPAVQTEMLRESESAASRVRRQLLPRGSWAQSL